MSATTCIQVTELTVQEAQLVRLPVAMLELLESKGRPGLFLIETDFGTLTLRTVADHLDSTLVPRFPPNLRRADFLSAPLCEELSAIARDIIFLPRAELRPDGTLEIPSAVLLLPTGSLLRLEITNPLPSSGVPGARRLRLVPVGQASGSEAL